MAKSRAKLVKVTEKSGMALSALKTSSKYPGDLATAEDAAFLEVDEADKLRGIDSDSGSDSESEAELDTTSVLSLFTKVQTDESKDNKRARRFFFKHIEETLALTRTLEFATGSHTNKQKRTTGQYDMQSEVDNTDMTCILNNCNQTHKSGRKRPSRSLAFCPVLLVTGKSVPVKWSIILA